MDAELFDVSKSFSLLVTVAVLVIWPAAPGVTVMVTITVAPAAMVLSVQPI